MCIWVSLHCEGFVLGRVAPQEDEVQVIHPTVKEIWDDVKVGNVFVHNLLFHPSTRGTCYAPLSSSCSV